MTLNVLLREKNIILINIFFLILNLQREREHLRRSFQEKIIRESRCGHQGDWSSWDLIESGACGFPVCAEDAVAYNTLGRRHNCTGEEQIRQEVSEKCEVTACSPWSGN